jgi:hypothetical protein
MAFFEITEEVRFPLNPVLDPITRARLIAEISGQLLSSFVGSTVNHTEKTSVAGEMFSKTAAYLVYKAEELSVPPKIPSSS